MPFVLAVFALLHLIALHTAGSSNPLGITSNVDKLSMHPYYSFKLRRCGMSLYLVSYQAVLCEFGQRTLVLGRL